MKKLSQMNLLKNATALSKQEMKHVLGGNSFNCTRYKRDDDEAEPKTMDDVPLEFGYLWCNIWTDLGWECYCESN